MLYNFGVIAQEYDTDAAPSNAEKRWFYRAELEVTVFVKQAYSVLKMTAHKIVDL
jgi:hypothetical protein